VISFRTGFIIRECCGKGWGGWRWSVQCGGGGGSFLARKAQEMKYGADIFLLELNDETSRKYCRSGKKNWNEFT
jgi:hypothetical protein